MTRQPGYNHVRRLRRGEFPFLECVTLYAAVGLRIECAVVESNAGAARAPAFNRAAEARNPIRVPAALRVAQRNQEASRRPVEAVIASAPGVDVYSAIRGHRYMARVADLVREDGGAEARRERDAAITGIAGRLLCVLRRCRPCKRHQKRRREKACLSSMSRMVHDRLHCRRGDESPKTFPSRHSPPHIHPPIAHVPSATRDAGRFSPSISICSIRFYREIVFGDNSASRKVIHPGGDPPLSIFVNNAPVFLIALAEFLMFLLRFTAAPLAQSLRLSRSLLCVKGFERPADRSAARRDRGSGVRGWMICGRWQMSRNISHHWRCRACCRR